MAARTFYRLVKADTPTVVDFLSAKALGLPRRPNEPQDIWEGLSVWATEAQARRQQRRFPRLGGFAAVLVIDDEQVRIARTYGPGHHTIWGDPSALLAAVTLVVPLT
jgi:hypothetical protein